MKSLNWDLYRLALQGVVYQEVSCRPRGLFAWKQYETRDGGEGQKQTDAPRVEGGVPFCPLIYTIDTTSDTLSMAFTIARIISAQID